MYCDDVCRVVYLLEYREAACMSDDQWDEWEPCTGGLTPSEDGGGNLRN